MSDRNYKLSIDTKDWDQHGYIYRNIYSFMRWWGWKWLSKTQIEIISSRFIGDVLPKAMRSKRQKKILKTFKAHADNDGYLVDFFEKKPNVT